MNIFILSRAEEWNLSYTIYLYKKTNMRIIGHIEHPVLKITVFKMDMRITVKFEDANFEQGFKFRMSDQIAHFEDVKRLVDEKFIADVLEGLKAQQHTKISAMDRFIQLNSDDEFDVIV